MKEFKLSDKIEFYVTQGKDFEHIYLEDVKEFISRLKDYINWLNNQFQSASHTHTDILNEIDKLSGLETN